MTASQCREGVPFSHLDTSNTASSLKLQATAANRSCSTGGIGTGLMFSIGADLCASVDDCGYSAIPSE
jgi:hypothetical protein